jgi:hypothetical protein
LSIIGYSSTSNFPFFLGDSVVTIIITRAIFNVATPMIGAQGVFSFFSVDLVEDNVDLMMRHFPGSCPGDTFDTFLIQNNWHCIRKACHPNPAHA